MLFSNANKAPKVSILVPIYNTSKYLPECLDSLLGQTLKDIEIVCINDGSTDNSPDIIREYQKRDSRVKLVDKANSGYGDSMNKGIEHATGEYIGICESDDFASPDMFETLWRYAHRHRLDVVKCNYFEHDASGDREMHVYDGYKYKHVFDPAKEQSVLAEIPIIWSALYRRQFIIDNGIAFNTTPGASYQDTSFVQQCWMAARRAALLPYFGLHYRVDNTASSCKSSTKIYEVCGEYELSEKFMARDPERQKAFAPMLNYLKFGTYRWNFNRIAEEHRRAFAQRWADEYKRAEQAGTLDKNYFPPENWERMELLMSDLDAFMEKYGQEL